MSKLRNTKASSLIWRLILVSRARHLFSIPYICAAVSNMIHSIEDVTHGEMSNIHLSTNIYQLSVNSVKGEQCVKMKMKIMLY